MSLIHTGFPVASPWLSIGTAGFPFPWKGFDVVIEAAKRLHGIANLVCPQSEHVDVNPFRMRWRTELGTEKLAMEMRWLKEAEVVRLLAQSTVNVYYYDPAHSHLTGQSGAVRLGLAARRPIILSVHRQFRSLFEYEDEIYFADNKEHAIELIAHVNASLKQGSPVRMPSRVIAEQGWSCTGRLYESLIERLSR